MELLGNLLDNNSDNDLDYLENHVSDFLITHENQTFEIEFEMTENTDNNSIFSFQICGDIIEDIFIGNIFVEKVIIDKAKLPVVGVLDFKNNENTNYLNVPSIIPLIAAWAVVVR